jgi:hypothetical protein
MFTLIIQAIFFTAFGLTLFGVPYSTLVAQVAALIFGVYLIIKAIKASNV